jgi:hypothetical protein
MNRRQRILALLNGETPDYVPWFGDLDYWYTALSSSDKLPQKYQNEGIFELHRDLGVGFYLQGYFPFKTTYEGITISEEFHGDRRVTKINTPHGDLTSLEKYLPESFCWAYEEHFLKSWKDLASIRYLYQNTHYQADYQKASERYGLIGDEGLVLCYLPRSPFMELVAVMAGIASVTNAFIDAPDEFDETISIMESKTDEAAEIALSSPAECLMIPENLSSEVVGKKFFNHYLRPYEEKWNQKIHKLGKYSFIHIDGTLRGLIREASYTGFNVLEAVTPAPVGDLPIEEIHHWVRPGSIIWGGLPGIYFTDLIDDQEFDKFTVRVLLFMRTHPRHVLGVADQVPPGSRWERIRRVDELVRQYGKIEY